MERSGTLLATGPRWRGRRLPGDEHLVRKASDVVQDLWCGGSHSRDVPVECMAVFGIAPAIHMRIPSRLRQAADTLRLRRGDLIVILAMEHEHWLPDPGVERRRREREEELVPAIARHAPRVFPSGGIPGGGAVALLLRDLEAHDVHSALDGSRQQDDRRDARLLSSYDSRDGAALAVAEQGDALGSTPGSRLRAVRRARTSSASVRVVA